MKFHLIPVRTLLLAGVFACCQSAFAQQFTITSTNETSIPAGSVGAVVTANGDFSTLISSGDGMCFYTGYGSTAPIIPVADQFSATMQVPASTIDNIPPGAFVGGAFNALIYVAPMASVCNGQYDPVLTNSATLPIDLPTVTTIPTPLPQQNPNLPAPPPANINLQGANFTTTTTIQFTGSASSATSTGFFISQGSVNAPLPAAIFSNSSVSATLCNHTAVADFCSTPIALTLFTPAAATGSVSALPTPGSPISPETVTATFAPTPGSFNPAPGAPSGAVTFTGNGKSLGAANLILDQTTANFQAVAAQDLPSTSNLVITKGDFNGDGLQDIVLSSGNFLYVLLATTPYGNYAPYINFNPDEVCFAAGGMAAGDLNGDGFTDLIYSCYGDTGLNVNVLMSNGDGTFQPAIQLPNVYGNVPLLADFTHHGKLDLVLAGPLDAQNAIQGFALLTGNGDGTFTQKSNTVTATNPGVGKVLVADVNGDGYPDVLALNVATMSNYTVDAYQNTKSGNFGTQAGATYSPTVSSVVGAYGGPLPGNFFLGDFNGDGLPDVGLVNGSAVETLLNTSKSGGNLSFGTLNTFSVAGLQTAVAGDFNGDGRSDVAVFDGTNVYVMDADASGNLVTDYSGLTVAASTVNAMFATDVNTDGYADLVLAIPSVVNQATIVGAYVTSGSANATIAPTLPPGTIPLAATWQGNNNFSAANGSSSLTINPIPTTNSLVVAPTTTEFGQPVSFTATLGQTSGFSLPIGGTLTVYDNQTIIDTVPVTGFTVSGMYAGLGAGAHSISAFYSGDANYAASNTAGGTPVTVTQALPAIAWTPSPATITYGTALGNGQLDAVASTTYFSSVPGTYVYTPPAGTILSIGTHSLSVTFTPTDTADFKSATGTANIIVGGETLASISPATANLGDPATVIAVTGARFAATSVIQVNGAAIPTTFVSTTTLSATIPAANLLAVATLNISVADPVLGELTNSVPFSVVAPPVAATLNGPSSSAPGEQPTVNLTLTNPYPVLLTATLTLSFTPAQGFNDDPAIQFAAGGRTQTFSVAANSTTTPPVQLQSGTVAGTITITLTLTAGGVDVTPPSTQPLLIQLPQTVPAISSAAITRSANTLTIVVEGFSNTREITEAKFHFLPAVGASISDPDVSVPVGTIFSTWFGSDTSTQYGSLFKYTQTFTLDHDSATIGSVSVTLTNIVGQSSPGSAQ